MTVARPASRPQLRLGHSPRLVNEVYEQRSRVPRVDSTSAVVGEGSGELERRHMRNAFWL